MTKENKKQKFLSLEEAKKYVKPLGIKNKKEWLQYVKSGKKPDNIPADPEKYYQSREYLMKTKSGKLELAWQELAKAPINKGIKYPTVCENSGETWQCVGIEGNEYCFRHRMHPKNEKEYTYINIILKTI